MPDENTPTSPAPQAPKRNPGVATRSTGFATGTNAPPAQPIRRIKTTDDGPSMRRRSYTNRSDASFDDGLPPALNRRSSNFSDYSLSEARDILNPRANAEELSTPEASSLASVSLAFALLPALTGALFKNGHSVVTDILLLGLSGVFLHWSVTQPWVWYHDAQQVRIQKESESETAAEEEDVADGTLSNDGHKPTDLDDVPEEDDETANPHGSVKGQIRTSASSGVTTQQQAALRELYMHESLALLSCFLLPLVSAYLLHHIRAQISRPSEGLVSNFNLTIFLLVSELRAFSYAFKLVQSRTLHLQRVLHGNPFASPNHRGGQIEELTERLIRLEERFLADEFFREQGGGLSFEPGEGITRLARDVRNAIQPELDALNRAVRRYEKKATTLQYQTDSRFLALDSRLDDAIALAAVAAKNSSSKNVFVRTVESLVTIVLFPFNTIIRFVLLPLRSLLSWVTFTKAPTAAKHSRAARTGKQSPSRYGGDRVPPRVMKR